MAQTRIPAVFIRGGTSKGIFFRREHLPASREEWDAVFLAAIGSPDAYGRQLDGMGGGISSLSKIVVVEPSRRPDADIEYTFGQVAVGEPVVEYGNNCGNLTSAVGPFAIDEGIVHAAGREAVVRLYNCNTNKHIVARFTLEGGEAAVEGGFRLQGVAGSGAPIRLEFQDPGGAVTGRLLPTGAVRDTLDVPGVGRVEVSVVDATTSVAFVRAEAVGLTGTESPDAIEANGAAMDRLEAIRRAAAVRAGLAASVEDAATGSRNRPFIAVVAPPRAATSLSGEPVAEADADVTARALSMGRPHRALPLTAAMCLAAAARIEGTVVHEVARPPASGGADLRIANPSGVIPLAASVRRAEGGWHVDDVVTYRTARRLMEGSVLVPASRLGAGA
jgi:2-methylaconitate cis-trans-isomerase PrpF